MEPHLIWEYQIVQRWNEISKLIINNQIQVKTFNIGKELNQISTIDEDEMYGVLIYYVNVHFFHGLLNFYNL